VEQLDGKTLKVDWPDSFARAVAEIARNVSLNRQALVPRHPDGAY
jgi:hypothetical protein